MKFYELIILIILVSLCVGGCKNTNKNPSEDLILKHQMTVLKTDSNYAIFKNENYFQLPENVKSANLSQDELLVVDTLLLIAINNYNKEIEGTIEEWKLKKPNIDENYFILHYSLYNYQLVPVINESGEKIVWINALCKDSDLDRWKKDVFFIMDGGNCFFNLKINLTKEEIFEFMVNGVA